MSIYCIHDENDISNLVELLKTRFTYANIYTTNSRELLFRSTTHLAKNLGYSIGGYHFTSTHLPHLTRDTAYLSDTCKTYIDDIKVQKRFRFIWSATLSPYMPKFLIGRSIQLECFMVDGSLCVEYDSGHIFTDDDVFEI